jgi:Putative adhesin
MKRGHTMTTAPTTGPVTIPPRRPAALRMTPGRWATLAIGVPIALVLIGWSAFSLVASIGGASFPVSATIPLQNGRLVASTGGGDITVHQGQVSGGTARLTGKVEYSLVRPTFTVSGSGISLHCRLPTGNCGLNATLDVPSHTAVDLNTGGGNMQVSGIQGNVTLDSSGGDARISGIAGAADVLTGGGNLTASHLGGVLNFTTSGGDVDGSGLFSPHVTTGSGGGNVTLVFTAVPEYVKISSSGGDITIVVPSGNASYAITSNASGGDYHSTVPTNDASPHSIQVDSGGGNISIAEVS